MCVLNIWSRDHQCVLRNLTIKSTNVNEYIVRHLDNIKNMSNVRSCCFNPKNQVTLSQAYSINHGKETELKP